MAATLFKTYDQVGIKEDISDLISNISPTKTPFSAGLKSEKVSNTIFQWQEDSLASVNLTNAQPEGFDAVDASLAPTVMRSQYTQILSKTVRVSATSDVVGTYGRAKETAYQISKASAELKRDLEGIMVGQAQNASAGTGGTGIAASARKMGSVFGNDISGNAIIAAAVTVDKTATPSALTEQNILDVNQKLYAAGSEANVIMVKPTDALLIAGFTNSAGRTRTINDGGRTVVNAVDLYVSPYGEQKVVINRFIKADSALVFDSANWKQVTLRPWTRELLAKTGDSDRHMIVGEFSLKHLNYSASGAIKGLT
jgi:hypothetical protein